MIVLLYERSFIIRPAAIFNIRKFDIKQKMKNGRSVHCNGFTVTVIFQTEKNTFCIIVLFMFNSNQITGDR